MEKLPEMKSLGRERDLLIPAAQVEAFSRIENGEPCIMVFSAIIVKDWAVWSITTIPSDKQDAAFVHLFSMITSAAFDIGTMGVVRTAQDILEPRINP